MPKLSLRRNDATVKVLLCTYRYNYLVNNGSASVISNQLRVIVKQCVFEARPTLF